VGQGLPYRTRRTVTTATELASVRSVEGLPAWLTATFRGRAGRAERSSAVGGCARGQPSGARRPCSGDVPAQRVRLGCAPPAQRRPTMSTIVFPRSEQRATRTRSAVVRHTADRRTSVQGRIERHEVRRIDGVIRVRVGHDDRVVNPWRESGREVEQQVPARVEEIEFALPDVVGVGTRRDRTEMSGSVTPNDHSGVAQRAVALGDRIITPLSLTGQRQPAPQR